jgi:hypothetical protein
MWVIVRVRELAVVGYFKPSGEWEPLRDFDSDEEAAQYVHWLNGGYSRDIFFSPARRT